MPYGSEESFCNIGNAKAMVLPDPVFALPMQSWPNRHQSVVSGVQSKYLSYLQAEAEYKLLEQVSVA